jgi:hypothetical protein
MFFDSSRSFRECKAASEIQQSTRGGEAAISPREFAGGTNPSQEQLPLREA